MNSLIVVVIVIVFSFLKWVFQQVAAQAEKRRQQQALERQQLERLRTGRVESPQSEIKQASPRATREGETRRREELAELRRRAASRRGHQAKPTQSSGTVPPALEILLGLPPGVSTGGTASPPSRTPRDRASKSRSLKPQRPQATGSQPDPEVEAQRRAEKRRNADIENAAAETRRQQEALERQRAQDRIRAAATRAAANVEQRLLRDAKPITAAGLQRPAAARGNLMPKSASEWRHAIAMNEMLGKPVSLR